MKPYVRVLTVFLTLIATGVVGAAPHAPHHAAKVVHHAVSSQPPYDANAIIGFFVWVGCLIAAYLLAKAKKRNPTGWVILSIPFAFVPLIILLFMPQGTYVSPQRLSKEQQSERERVISQKLAEIQSGRLTPFIPLGVMPQANEQFYWEQRAQYGQTMKQTTHRGSTPALYVPLGHGMKARVGGYQGSSQNVTNFVWGPMGTVFLSNQRILFKADTGDVANAPFAEIITYDAYPNGLSLNVRKIGVMQFKTGDECLGAAFLKMVQAPPKQELTAISSDGEA